MDVINSAFCICCRRSLNRVGGTRRRSYNLTAEFVQNNPSLMTYLVEIANVVQVSFVKPNTSTITCMRIVS